MTAPLVDRNTGDIIYAADVNDIKDYIEDGTYRVNTLSLSIGGTEAISSDRYFKPARLHVPSGGLSIYDSTGATVVAKIDESGNLHLLGGVLSL